MSNPSKTDPWQKICDKSGLSAESISFVSPVIKSEVIREFGQPRFLIPIYSMKQWSRYPFLQTHGLIPLRVGIGTAVLTRARLLIPITESTDRTLPLRCNRSTVPSSLLVSVSTEAKYLALAFETGVFNAALEIPGPNGIMQGLFGKMNLPTANIGLQDDQGSVVPVDLTNVQFDLDYCLETNNDIYLFEAKTGSLTSFNLLQLFYPLTIVRELAEETGKKIHTILLKIGARSDAVSYTFYEYRFRDSSIANSAVREGSVKVELEIVH